MGKAAGIIINAAITVAATLAFGPAGGFAAFGGISLTTGAVLAGLGSLALGFVSSALQPKPKTPSFAPFAAVASGRTQSVRQAISPHVLVLGEVPKLGGPLVFYEATESNKYHHLVIILAAHQVQAMPTVWLNDEPVYADEIDGAGAVTAGKFAGKVRIKKHLGAADQEADADLVAETSATEEHRARGRAYLYVRVQWDRDVFPNGLPNIAARVKGALAEDPRVSGAAFWTNNGAVALRHWMTTAKSKGGMGVATARLDDTFATAAANVCDEYVDSQPVTMTASAVSAAADTISLSGEKSKFLTADRVELATTGVAPGGLIATGSPSAVYYVIVHQEQSTDSQAVKIKLAATAADALAEVAVDITDAGTGTLSVTKTGEPRYTIDGVIDTSRKRADILRDLSTAIGRIPVYAGGQWRIQAAAWSAPAVTLSESDLRGKITGTTRVTHRERFNAVKGIYVSPLNDGQPTDYPAALSATYLANDGGGDRKYFDHDLPFTARTQMAQRLAWIVLKRHRNELTYHLRCSMAAYQVQAGNTISITNTARSWTTKSFEVEETTLGVESDGKGSPVFVVDIRVKAADSTDYDFAFASDETVVEPAPLPTNAGFAATNPTNLALASGTDNLDIRLDGTVFSRIKMTWTAPTDEFVLQGGKLEIEAKKDSDATWTPKGTVEDPANVTFFYILDVQDGVDYGGRIRSVNSIGVRNSAWLTVTGHTVVGKTAAPSTVASLTVQQNGPVVTFKWPQVSDLDLAGYELRYAPVGTTSWDAMTSISSITRGTLVTNAALPPGSWTVGIKAVDTSGNYSAAVTTATIVVANTFDVVFSRNEHPHWAGQRSGLVKHDVSGTLIPESQTLAADMTDAQLWDQMVYNPVLLPFYEAGEIDLTFDADNVRVYSNQSTVLGPGESGNPTSDLQIDYRDAAASYDGFEDWPTAAQADFRYLKARAVLDPSSGAAYLDEFAVIADVEERSEHAEDVLVAVGGADITFAQQFHAKPNVQATADDSGSPQQALFPVKSSVSATGFRVTVYNAAGADVGGLVDYTAIGA